MNPIPAIYKICKHKQITISEALFFIGKNAYGGIIRGDCMRYCLWDISMKQKLALSNIIFSLPLSLSYYVCQVESLGIRARKGLIDHLVQKLSCVPWSLVSWKVLRGHHKKGWQCPKELYSGIPFQPAAAGAPLEGFVLDIGIHLQLKKGTHYLIKVWNLILVHPPQFYWWEDWGPGR